MNQRGGGSTLARLRLGARLRALREDLRITGEQAAAAIGSSSSKIYRMERAQLPVKPRDVTRLLNFYGVTDQAERDGLLSLAVESSAPGWWDAFSDDLPALSVHTRHSLEMEAAATLVMVYDPQAVPVLLQTPDYARAVSSELPQRMGWRGGLGAAAMARRRDLLVAAQPPQVWAVIDEPVLWRAPQGNREILAGQIGHLIHQAGRPGILSPGMPDAAVQIVPADSPGPLAAPGPFSIVRLPGPDLHDVVILEQLTAIVTADRLQDVDRYWALFNWLALRAHGRTGSLQVLQDIARSLDDSR
jgi:transcriptional regulator with XRE-family HTH domain